MSQMCPLPYCQYLWREAAVYAINNPGSSLPPHINSHINFPVHLQAQLVNWRPSVYHPNQQRLYPTYDPLYQRIIAMQQRPTDNNTWALPIGDSDEKPHYLAQPNVFFPQHDHTFFDEQVNYRPEQSMLYNPFKRFAPNGSSRPMEMLTKAFAPTTSRASDSVSLPSIDKVEGTLDMPRINTNVDPNQFQPVRREDWSTASIEDLGTDDENALSPASTEANSHGPYTPQGLEGEAGFPEAAMRRFSQELSTSFESNGSDMFRNVHRDVDFPSTSRELTTTKQVAAAPPSMIFQHRNHSHHVYEGLPYIDGNAYTYPDCSSTTTTTTTTTAAPAVTAAPAPAANANESDQTILLPATFRDADGLPFNHAATPPTREQRASTSSSFSTVSSQAEPQSEQETETSTASAHRRRRDKALLDMREKGHTYKFIKRSLKFTEAESTLRGRVRQLTKDKSERVRRPRWTDNDIRLLRTAVTYHRKLREEGAYIRHRDGKLPWKQIAERMRNDGASYMFAPATCAKKYEEIGGR